MVDLIWHIKSFEELTTGELYQILKARAEVFVVEQNCPYLDTDGKDELAYHLWATSKGNLLAYCRIFPASVQYEETSIGRVLTTAEGRGHGLGKTMMSLAIQSIETLYNTGAIRISAQDYLIAFYQGFGFELTGKSYLEDGLPHSEMVRNQSM